MSAAVFQSKISEEAVPSLVKLLEVIVEVEFKVIAVELLIKVEFNSM